MKRTLASLGRFKQRISKLKLLDEITGMTTVCCLSSVFHYCSSSSSFKQSLNEPKAAIARLLGQLASRSRLSPSSSTGAVDSSDHALKEKGEEISWAPAFVSRCDCGHNVTSCLIPPQLEPLSSPHHPCQDRLNPWTIIPINSSFLYVAFVKYFVTTMRKVNNT